MSYSRGWSLQLYTEKERLFNELFKGRVAPRTHRERRGYIVSYLKGRSLQLYTEKERAI